MGRILHMCLSVRGALAWNKAKLRNGAKWITRKDGTRYTPEQLRDALMDELAAGHEVIPMGTCDNFDFKKGCLGHATPDECRCDDVDDNQDPPAAIHCPVHD